MGGAVASGRIECRKPLTLNSKTPTLQYCISHQNTVHARPIFILILFLLFASFEIKMHATPIFIFSLFVLLLSFDILFPVDVCVGVHT